MGDRNKRLIQAGQSIDGRRIDVVNARDLHGNSALHLATTAAQVTEFIRLGAPLEVVNGRSLTPLQTAVIAGRTDVAKSLIEAGADRDVLEPDTDNSLLQLAPNAETAKLLVECGAPLERPNRYGRTPLLEACLAGRLDVVLYLLNAGADVGKVRENKTSCLHYLCMDGDLPQATALLEYGWDPSARDRDDATPLHVCARFGQVEVAKVLLRYGANKELRDKWGRTPLDCIPTKPSDRRSGELAELLSIPKEEAECPIADETQFETVLRERLASRWNCPLPVGLAAAEISDLETKMGMELRGYFRTFHSICGAEAGELFDGYAWKLAELSARQQELALFCEENQFQGADGFFSFVDDIGDYFWCFRRDDRSADPLVWMLGDDGFRSLDMRFSEFVLSWEQW